MHKKTDTSFIGVDPASLNGETVFAVYFYEATQFHLEIFGRIKAERKELVKSWLRVGCELGKEKH